MKINVFFRHRSVGYSIQRVVSTIMQNISKKTIVNEVYLPNPKSDVLSVLQNGFYAAINQSNINYISGDVHYLLYFICGSKTVVTVHDIMYYSYLSGIKKHIWKLLYISSLKRAHKIVFISEFAQNQVLNEIVLPKTKYTIIPNAISPDYRFVAKEFNTTKPIILHIGTLNRKNLDRTIEALNGICCHLKIIGKLSESTINLLYSNGIEFSNAFDLSNKEIVEEYKNCDIVNFPSIFEGFGMPIIEAQATGRIVVTSNISPMCDVAGNYGLLVDPYSIESIRNAYLEIIEDEQLRASLIKKGLINVEKYQIDNISLKYLEIFKQIDE